MAFIPTIQQTIAPNLPSPGPAFSQDYLNQLTNALRLYFAQIDNFTRASAVVQYGTTASRPAVGLTIGQNYFDQTLNIPIWWNGSHWVNASGTTV